MFWVSNRFSRRTRTSLLRPWLLIAYIVVAAGTNGSDFPQKEFAVPEGFLPDLMMGLPKNSALAGCIRADMRPILKRMGATFPEGCSAQYLPADERLIVRDTQENLILISELIDQFAARNPPSDLAGSDSLSESSPGPSICLEYTPSERTEAFLSHVILVRAEMEETSLKESIEWLSKQVHDRDTLQSDESKRGARFILTPAAEKVEARISIDLRLVTALEALKYFVTLANSYFEIDEHGAVIIDHPPSGLFMYTKRYKIPAAAIGRSSGSVHAPDGVIYPSVRELFIAFGVEFPDGSSAGLATNNDSIVIRNTEENIEIAKVVVAGLVDANGGRLNPNYLQAMKKIIRTLRVARK